MTTTPSHRASTKVEPTTVRFSATSGTFKVVSGAPAPDRLTLAGLAPMATLQVAGGQPVTVPVTDALAALAGSGKTEAVVRIPDAAKNQDAIAVAVSGFSTNAQGDVSVKGGAEQRVRQSQLADDAAGLDTKLPARFQMANVTVVKASTDINCNGTGRFKCTFNTEITKFGVRGAQVKCPVYVYAVDGGGTNQGTIYTKPDTATQPPTDPTVKSDYFETDTVTWGHAFSRLVSKMLLTFHPDPAVQSKFPYKVDAYVWCTDQQANAWVVASIVP